MIELRECKAHSMDCPVTSFYENYRAMLSEILYSERTAQTDLDGKL